VSYREASVVLIIFRGWELAILRLVFVKSSAENPAKRNASPGLKAIAPFEFKFQGVLGFWGAIRNC